MPAALLKACSWPGGCPELSSTGRCPDHTRGTAAKRGYDRKWQALRKRFRRLLIQAGAPPVCGARLPGARPGTQSRCLAQGVLMDDSMHQRKFGTTLHTDHIIPHGGDPQLFSDVNNLQLLCRNEHSEKTAREDGGFGQ